MSNDLLTADDTLLMLDEMLGHEAKCAGKHDTIDNLECSVIATHRYRTECGVDKLICAKAAARTQKCILGEGVCGTCFKPVAADWTVRPA